MRLFLNKKWSLCLLFCAILGNLGRAADEEPRIHGRDPVSERTEEVSKKDDPDNAEPTLELPTPANRVKALRKEAWDLGGNLSKEKSEEVESKLSEIHSQEIANLPEGEREAYLKKLPYKEKENLQKVMDQNVEKLRSNALFGPGTEEAKKKYAEALKLQEAVEQVNFLPILGEMRKFYREERDRLEEKFQKGGTPREKAEYSELKSKIDAFNLIPIEEMQQLKRTKSPLFSNDKDPHSDKFIAENSDKVEAAQKEVAARLPSSIRDDFNKLFKPHAKFSEGNEPEIGFTPTDELLKRQIEQRIAFGTKAYGDGHVSLERSGKLNLPESAEESLSQLAGMKQAGLDKMPISQLSDRSGIRSHGIERTNDEFNVAAAVAGPVKSMLELGFKKTVVSLGYGGAAGGFLDGAMQAAESLDAFGKTGKWKTPDPVRAVMSVGMGALLGPLIARNQMAGYALGGMGIKDGIDHAANGDYASALVSGGTSALAFLPKSPPKGIAVAGDFHLAVRKTSTGEIVLDTDSPSFGYFKSVVSDLKKQGRSMSEILLNGDVLDARALKEVGAPPTPEIRAKLIKQAVDYAKSETGTKVRFGMGNHELIKNPETGIYEGKAVAEALTKLGVDVFTSSDVETATINLPQKVDGKTVAIEVSHKVINSGKHLAATFDEGTTTRVINDAVAAKNPQAGPAISGKVTNDVHTGRIIVTEHGNAPGKDFVFVNAGAANGEVSVPFTIDGGDTAFNIGSYVRVYSTSKAGISVEFQGVNRFGGAGRLEPGRTGTFSWGESELRPMQMIDERLGNYTQEKPYSPSNSRPPLRIPSYSSDPDSQESNTQPVTPNIRYLRLKKNNSLSE